MWVPKFVPADEPLHSVLEEQADVVGRQRYASMSLFGVTRTALLQQIHGARPRPGRSG